MHVNFGWKVSKERWELNIKMDVIKILFKDIKQTELAQCWDYVNIRKSLLVP
jgi:hypothetical protein